MEDASSDAGDDVRWYRFVHYTLFAFYAGFATIPFLSALRRRIRDPSAEPSLKDSWQRLFFLLFFCACTVRSAHACYLASVAGGSRSGIVVFVLKVVPSTLMALSLLYVLLSWAEVCHWSYTRLERAWTHVGVSRVLLVSSCVVVAAELSVSIGIGLAALSRSSASLAKLAGDFFLADRIVNGVYFVVLGAGYAAYAAVALRRRLQGAGDELIPNPACSGASSGIVCGGLICSASLLARGALTLSLGRGAMGELRELWWFDWAFYLLLEALPMLAGVALLHSLPDRAERRHIGSLGTTRSPIQYSNSSSMVM
eukprot:m51a1_g11383 hypothetical protein (312) ;mRNA; f:4718-6022